MPKNTTSIEEEAENVQLNTFEEDVADAGADSPDEGHDTTKLALAGVPRPADCRQLHNTLFRSCAKHDSGRG